MTVELLGASVEVGAPRFRLDHAVVDRPLSGGAGHFVAERERAILSVTGVGTFAVENGVRIRLQPEPETPSSVVSIWLHGTVAGLLLAQRGEFALHASVAAVGGRGVALAGTQRAGKSTTALRLAQLGHQLVTDDVSPLVTGEPIMVHPYRRPVHVVPETAALLGLDLADAQPILLERSKLALPVPQRDPIALGAIAVLQTGDERSGVHVSRVRGASAHSLVGLNIYRARLLRDLWQVEMFDWAGEVAERVPVHVVTRPVGDWTVDAVARAVERLADDGRRAADQS
jgi:hypothetical protein